MTLKKENQIFKRQTSLQKVQSTLKRREVALSIINLNFVDESNSPTDSGETINSSELATQIYQKVLDI